MANKEIVNTLSDALSSARSIEELADALLTAGFVFRSGKEFVRADGREPLWCEECSHFKGGPDGEGECLADCQPTWYACCACQSYAPKSSVDCISRSELLGIIDRAMEERRLKDSLTALRLFRETVENLSSVIPTCMKESCAELEAMRSAANSFKIHNAKLTEEKERLEALCRVNDSVGAELAEAHKVIKRQGRELEELRLKHRGIIAPNKRTFTFVFTLGYTEAQAIADSLKDCAGRFATPKRRALFRETAEHIEYQIKKAKESLNDNAEDNDKHDN